MGFIGFWGCCSQNFPCRAVVLRLELPVASRFRKLPLVILGGLASPAGFVLKPRLGCVLLRFCPFGMLGRSYFRRRFLLWDLRHGAPKHGV